MNCPECGKYVSPVLLGQHIEIDCSGCGYNATVFGEGIVRNIELYMPKLAGDEIGGAADEIIPVPREALERWREALLNQEWEEYPDDMREIIDSMDALLSTNVENEPGIENE